MSTVAGGAILPRRGKLRAAGRERTARPRGERLRRALRLVIATLLLMLALEVVFYLLLVPRLRLTTVTVATDLALDDAEVLAMAGLAGDEQFFSIDAAAIEQHLEQHLLVRDAAVSLRFPDTLRLDLTARKAAAAVLVTEADGHTAFRPGRRGWSGISGRIDAVGPRRRGRRAGAERTCDRDGTGRPASARSGA